MLSPTRGPLLVYSTDKKLHSLQHGDQRLAYSIERKMHSLQTADERLPHSIERKMHSILLCEMAPNRPEINRAWGGGLQHPDRIIKPPLGGPRLLLLRRQLTTTSAINTTITTTATTTTAEGSSKSAPQFELPVSFRRGLLTEVSSLRAPSALFKIH